MDLKTILTTISSVLMVAAIIPYVYQILTNQVKPQRMTWLIFLILGVIGLASSLVEGVGNGIWLLGTATFNVFLIFILSIWKGKGGWSNTDKVSLAFCLLICLIWWFTGNALYAVVLFVVGELLGYWITWKSAYFTPQDESLVMWSVAGVAGLVSLLALETYSFTSALYPAHIFISNFIVVGCILFGIRRLRNKH